MFESVVGWCHDGSKPCLIGDHKRGQLQKEQATLKVHREVEGQSCYFVFAISAQKILDYPSWQSNSMHECNGKFMKETEKMEKRVIVLASLLRQ